MLKVAHDSELFREMMKIHDIFSIEAGMYRDVVPELEQLYADAGVQVKFSAKSYNLSTDQPYILLENLKERGFRNVNRREGLDMQHTKCVLRKMAQWHAASAVRVATRGIYPKMYLDGYVMAHTLDMIQSMYEASGKVLLEVVKQFPKSHMYYEKIVSLHHKLAGKLYETAEYKYDDDFKVLIHGDAWVNNIMFRYEEETGEILDTYFVDYQIPRYTSPVQDLLYFILSSVQYEIKLQEFDYFIAFYHQQLVENLQLLKYPKKIPSLKDLHLMLYKHGIWGK